MPSATSTPSGRIRRRRAVSIGLAMLVAAAACTVRAAAADDGPALPTKVSPEGELNVRPAFKEFQACRDAAGGGDKTAMLELAWRYERGRGVQRNEAEAERWLRRAAELGCADSQFALGYRLAHAEEDGRDEKAACRHYALAAKQDHLFALHDYGLAHLSGAGVEKDEAAGHALLLRAAEAGYAPAQREAGRGFELGRGVEMDQKTAFQWYAKAAEQDDARAQRLLAHMYKDGRGAPRDESAALRWMLMAAREGLPEAQWDAAQIYLHGDGVPPDDDKAARWLEKLAEQNHREAQIELARLDPRKFQRLTRKLSFKRGRIRNEPDSPVRVEGRIVEMADDAWTLALRPRQSVVVHAARVADPRLQTGHYVSTWGVIGTDATVEALLCTVPPPQYEWKYEVQADSAVGGQVQTFGVAGTITNTGVQPIRSITLHVRLYQEQSPNDESRDVIVRDLACGERRPFSVRIRFYNFRYIGRTSIPRAEVTAGDLSW